MDKQLNIKTEGIQTDGKDTYHNHRYEPTPYEWLERLFTEYPLLSSDTLVDFGCGMGRLPFYVADRFLCQTKGIEMNPEYYTIAKENLESYLGHGKKSISFYQMAAQEYTVADADTVFYFFNPFSPEIFMRVMNNIQASMEHSMRKMTIILYYPDQGYIDYLEHRSSFVLFEAVAVHPGLSHKPRECFLIYHNQM